MNPCYLQDPEVLSSVLAFQRLLATWMMRIASPDTAATGAPPQLPLPMPVPFEFASLPVSMSVNAWAEVLRNLHVAG